MLEEQTTKTKERYKVPIRSQRTDFGVFTRNRNSEYVNGDIEELRCGKFLRLGI